MTENRFGRIAKLAVCWLAIAVLAANTPGHAAANTAAGKEAPLEIEMEHLILSVSGTEVSVLDILNVRNPSDKAVKVGQPARSGNPAADEFRYDLPKGAKDLKAMEESVKEIPAKGETTVAYAYKIPESGGHFVLSFNRPYPVKNLNVMVPEGQSKLVVQNQQMQDNGPMSFQGRNYHVYSAASIQPGLQLDMILLPTAENTSRQGEKAGQVTRTAPAFHNPGHIRMWYQSPLREFNPHILLIVFGSILAFAVGYYGYRKWKFASNNGWLEAEEEIFQQLYLKQKVLLNKLVELEDSYDRAELSDEDYQLRKKAYKSQLVEVKRKLLEFVK
ncbi:hypothetical protein [Effusibacillus lacus]|uniref:Uncharacterized protein n=1 Tax=Effusibacillus lacus TaxID=1348429 RepID=A0A292YJU0_9BACL|nr:hypothetical protein [Effusibacillus lacus]TCS76111.1 hypothetical protein EDD64_10483 [Effusibacillus lacus]GAX91377.1 hypothetical protein EFBL_3046 [Effusibacillus lacus]